MKQHISGRGPVGSLDRVDTLIDELEVEVSKILLPTAEEPLAPTTFTCTGGCTYETCDPTSDCTYLCTWNCTHGC